MISVLSVNVATSVLLVFGIQAVLNHQVPCRFLRGIPLTWFWNAGVVEDTVLLLSFEALLFIFMILNVVLLLLFWEWDWEWKLRQRIGTIIDKRIEVRLVTRGGNWHENWGENWDELMVIFLLGKPSNPHLIVLWLVVLSNASKKDFKKFSGNWHLYWK